MIEYILKPKTFVIRSYSLGVLSTYGTPLNISLMLPKNPQFMHFGVADSELTIWARVDPTEEKVSINFDLRWTGNGSPINETYVGTHIDHEIEREWHLFLKG